MIRVRDLHTQTIRQTELNSIWWKVISLRFAYTNHRFTIYMAEGLTFAYATIVWWIEFYRQKNKTDHVLLIIRIVDVLEIFWTLTFCMHIESNELVCDHLFGPLSQIE